MNDTELLDLAKAIVKAGADEDSDMLRHLKPEPLLALATKVVSTMLPFTYAEGVVIDDELCCPKCESSEHLRYEETLGAWRDVAKNEATDGGGEVNVTWASEDQDDGDSTPGLVCSSYRGGCGTGIIEPEGWELTYD